MVINQYNHIIQQGEKYIVCKYLENLKEKRGHIYYKSLTKTVYVLPAQVLSSCNAWWKFIYVCSWLSVAIWWYLIVFDWLTFPLLVLLYFSYNFTKILTWYCSFIFQFIIFHYFKHVLDKSKLSKYFYLGLKVRRKASKFC